MKYLIALLLPVLLAGTSVAQDKMGRVKVQFSSGAEAGFWRTNRGPYAPGITSANMIDGSRPGFSLPLEISGSYSLKRLLLGLEVRNNTLFIDEIIGFGDADDTPNRYYISERSSVNFTAFYLSVGLAAVDRKVYKFVPRISAGTFIDDSTHPEKDFFGARIAWKLSLQHEVHLGRVYVHLSPVYSQLRVRSAAGHFRDEGKHSIHQAGINVGLGVKL